MAEAKINQECIIGLPTCGYAFSSTRMAFIAAPADEEFHLEVDILCTILTEREYEAYVAIQNVDPARLAFCTKICSKIIQSQFCIVLLNSSSHRSNREIKIPNPNVDLEYGLMLAFHKYVLPLQREGDVLAFNIRPLDTLMYDRRNFRQVAERAIDQAILATMRTSVSTRPIASNLLLLRYLTVRGLKVTALNNEEAQNLFNLGSSLGFNLLDGPAEIVYFGFFDLYDAREVVFRLKLMLQSLSNAYVQFRDSNSKTMAPELVERAELIWSKIRVEVLISTELDQAKIAERVRELTSDLTTRPWAILTQKDLEAKVSEEFERIGEL